MGLQCPLVITYHIRRMKVVVCQVTCHCIILCDHIHSLYHRGINFSGLEFTEHIPSKVPSLCHSCSQVYLYYSMYDSHAQLVCTQMVEETVQSRMEQKEKPLEDMTLDELDELEDEEDERILQQYR